MDHLAEYQVFIEVQLEEAREKLDGTRKWLETTFEYEEQTDSDVEYYNEWYKHFESPYNEKVFPRCLRYSFILFVFLVLESELKAVCDEIQQRRNINTSANEIKDNILEKSKQYIEEHTGIKISNEPLWQRLTDLLKVRNCIAHAAGRVNQVRSAKDRRRLRDIAKDRERLFISDSDRTAEHLLIIEPKYCAEVVSDVHEFFGTVLGAIEMDCG